MCVWVCVCVCEREREREREREMCVWFRYVPTFTGGLIHISLWHIIVLRG